MRRAPRPRSHQPGLLRFRYAAVPGVRLSSSGNGRHRCLSDCVGASAATAQVRRGVELRLRAARTRPARRRPTGRRNFVGHWSFGHGPRDPPLKPVLFCRTCSRQARTPPRAGAEQRKVQDSGIFKAGLDDAVVGWHRTRHQASAEVAGVRYVTHAANFQRLAVQVPGAEVGQKSRVGDAGCPTSPSRMPVLASRAREPPLRRPVPARPPYLPDLRRY